MKASWTFLNVVLLTFGALSCQSDPTTPPLLAQRVPVDLTPSWSPNGEYIAYSHFQQAFNDTFATGLYVLELATGTRRLVAAGRTLSPSWFSDSRRIAFAAGPIFVVDMVSGVTTALIPGTNYNPSVSPSDTAVTYDSPLNSSSGSVVWVFTLATQSARDISAQGQGEWKHPQWSPDGTRILHFRYSGSANGTSELFTMGPTGRSDTQLTHNTVSDADPCWSPSGATIAWTLGYPYQPEIWLAKADGSGSRRLTLGMYPAFSPDGNRVVFVDPYSADGVDLHVINVDGTGYRPLW